VTALSRAAFAMAMLVSVSARATEHAWPPPPHAKGADTKDADARVSLSILNRAGLAQAPFFTSAFPEVSGFAAVLTGTAAVRFPKLGWLRLRLPVTFARLDFPAGAQVAETALGNLELGLEHELQAAPATRLGFVGALLAPSAQHGPETALLENRALALGSALNGGKDSALLTPGVTGLRLAASVEHTHHSLELRASLDLPLLARISDASLPEETATHPIGILPTLDLRAAYWLTSWLAASLGASLVTEPLRVQEPVLEADRKRRVQPVVEPGFQARLGQHVTLGLDGSIPLGTDAWSIGFLARVGF
jgi:hypothetical protein